jgi:hypothetical protein
MSRTMRDTFVIVRRELTDLTGDVALIIVALASAIGLPLYLGYLAAAGHLAAVHIEVWALEVTLVQVFLASTTALQGLAVEREQGTLMPLIMAPVSDAALFLGKALPSVLLSVGQAVIALGLFVIMLAALNHTFLLQLDLSAVSITAATTLSAAMMCAGIGLPLALRLRSSRAIALGLTLSSLAVISLESTLGLWSLLDPAGRALRFDTAVTQPALGLAILALGAAFYRRDRIVTNLWR